MDAEVARDEENNPKRPDTSRWGRTVGLVFIVLLAVLSCVFTRPLLGKAADSTYKHDYDPMFQAWTLSWDARTLAKDPLDLFNANIYFPNKYTLAYSDHQFTNAVIASPLLTLTDNPIQATNYMLIFNFFLCALGAYLLAMRLTGNRLAAFVAGVIFAFAPPRLAHLMHLQMSSAGWTPLCLLFLHRYSEDRKWTDAALAGLFLVVQTLATWYLGLILSIAIIVFLVVKLVMERRSFTLAWTATLLLVFVIAAGLIAPFAAPYLKIHAEDPRFVREVSEVELFSADVRDFAVASDQNFLWGHLTGSLREKTQERGGPAERSLFVGLMPLILSVAGAVWLFRKGRGRERFYVWFYVSLAAVAALLCLGSRLYFFGSSVNLPMPYDLLYYAFPGFKVIRVPPRFIILVILSLAMLSAFAMRAMLAWLSRRKSMGLTVAVAVAIVGLLLLDTMSLALPMASVPQRKDFPEVYGWLADQPGDAPTAELPLARYDPRSFDAGIQYETTWQARECPRTYYSTLHWKQLLNGYSGYIPDSYYEAVKATAGFPSKESIAWLKRKGVRYVIVHASLFDPVTLQEIFEWSLEHKDLQPWKVFDKDKKDKDYVYKLR